MCLAIAFSSESKLQLARNFKAVMGGLFYTHLLSCPFSEDHATSLEERLS